MPDVVTMPAPVRLRDDGEGNATLGTQSCWGESNSYDDACCFDSVEDLVSTPLAVPARSWARLTGNQPNTLTVHLAYAGDRSGLLQRVPAGILPHPRSAGGEHPILTAG